jgi:hypothetical protein
MKRDHDLDQTLKQWLDDGADQAPERFVWAALEDAERTAQRGVWRASLEGMLMKLKPAIPILSMAAVILLAVVAYRVLGGSRVGGPDEPSLSPRPMVVADLTSILPPSTGGFAPHSDPATFTWPGCESSTSVTGGHRIEIPRTGFVAARQTYLDGSHADFYTTMSELFLTADDARRAFALIVANYESPVPDGCGFEPSSVNPPLGDQSVYYAIPPSGYGPIAASYVWRVNNVVLTVFGTAGFPAELRDIADAMDARAH